MIFLKKDFISVERESHTLTHVIITLVEADILLYDKPEISQSCHFKELKNYTSFVGSCHRRTFNITSHTH